MALGKGGDDNDNPLHFSGEVKDWPTFKEAIQAHKAVDLKYLRQTNRMTVWLFRDTVFEHPAKEKTTYQTTQYPVKQ